MAEKKKRYYWLKLKRDFFKRHDIEIIEGMPNGKDYVLFYLKLLLESIDHDGMLRFSDAIPYDADMLSSVTHTNVDIVKGALNAFYKLKLIELWDDQTLFMVGVQKMIGTESDSAERMRRLREKKNLLGIEEKGEASHCDTNVRKCDVEKENRDKSIDIRDNIYPPIVPPTAEQESVSANDATAKGVVRNSTDEGKKKRQLDSSLDVPFQIWWDAYPKRRRGAKQECRKRYEAAIKNTNGLTPEKMLQALEAQKRTKDWQKQNGEFVPAPLTWLNQGRWEDEIYDPQTDANSEPIDAYELSEEDKDICI